MNATVTRINARDIGLRLLGELPGVRLGMSVDINDSTTRVALAEDVASLTKQLAESNTKLAAVTSLLALATAAVK